MGIRKFEGIVSQRKYSLLPSWKIVYEWEDIIFQVGGWKIVSESDFRNKIRRRFENLGIVEIFYALLPTRGLRLRFIMTAHKSKLCILNKNTIPVIIDFWLEVKDLPDFYKAYKHCPLILITSAEVVAFLRNNNCPLPIEHWPLSYPDIYRIVPSAHFEKKYEFTVFGRPNPFFIRLLEKYCLKHPDFTYIHSEGTEQNRLFIDHNGNVVAKDIGRNSYLEMIAKTKISCYTTPGLDESKKETGRFNQVTPRLFEMLGNGCSVIGHYLNNEDTCFYGLPNIVPNVDNYEQFELELDRLRKEPVSVEYISHFLDAHYTSTRVSTLKVILIKHDIV